MGDYSSFFQPFLITVDEMLRDVFENFNHVFLRLISVPSYAVFLLTAVADGLDDMIHNMFLWRTFFIGTLLEFIIAFCAEPVRVSDGRVILHCRPFHLEAAYR